MKRKRTAYGGLLAAAALAVGVLGLVAGFVPDAGSPFVRAPLSDRVLRAKPAVERPVAEGEQWRMRAAVARPGDAPAVVDPANPADPASPAAGAAMAVPTSTVTGGAQPTVAASPGLPDVLSGVAEESSPLHSVSPVSFVGGGVAVSTVDGHRPVDAMADASPMILPGLDPLRVDGGRLGEPMQPTLPTLIVEPAFYGEALDQAGRPLRWTSSETSRLLARECAATRRSAVAGVRRPAYGGASREMLAAATPEQMLLRARQYRDMVDRYARRYNLSPRLVLAIMHAESGFNPNAVSPAQALGLMQIVPETAGGEVHAYLHGTPGQPPRDALFDPGTNIRYGTVYLHLLSNRHFSDIANPATRELCVIAAYNGGPNALLRVFDADRDKAVALINAMTTQQVYDKLVRHMPADESRKYVDKVLASLENFSSVH
ncbi:transglycosylase SLT domain-containing protein [Nitratidesulfovibrio sp. 1201_IL3209]|uniref:transglycosylase SLT domain-containing protein n=1 Tax=Nitratidesulfovibrio sp. 1201_IL3209 TaxID=3084053 RepID=UPI002FDB4C8B